MVSGFPFSSYPEKAIDLESQDLIKDVYKPCKQTYLFQNKFTA